MKQLILTLALIGFVIGTAIGQFDKEPEIKSNDKEATRIESSMDKAISKIEKMIESIDIEEFFEEDLPEFIEDIKPSPETIDEIEDELREGVEKLKNFDSSVLDDLKDDIEEGVEEIKEELGCKRKPQKI